VQQKLIDSVIAELEVERDEILLGLIESRTKRSDKLFRTHRRSRVTIATN
jgi:hypothetical protein